MRKLLFTAIALMLTMAAAVSCRDNKEKERSLPPNHAAQSIKSPLKPLGDHQAPVAEGVTMQLVTGSTQPKPLVLYFGSASSAQAARNAFRQHAHLILAETVNPPLIRAAISKLKQDIGPHLGSAPIALVAESKRQHDSALKLTFEDPKFFGHLFFLNSADLRLSSTQLNALRERGLKQLGLDSKANNAVQLRELASRMGLKIELLSHHDSFEPTRALSEVVQRLAELDRRFSLLGNKPTQKN